MRFPAVIAFMLTLAAAAGQIVSTAAQDAKASRRPMPQAPPPTPQYPRVEYEADLRGFVFMGGLTNKGGRPANPYGEHPGWRIGEPGTIYAHLNLGMHRTILRQPVGPGAIGWVLFSSWHPLSDAQRLDFAAGIRDWKGEDYRRKVGVFFGRDCTNPFIRRDIGIGEGPLVPPDPMDPQAMLWWEQNVGPLAAIGVDEIWLDRGSATGEPDVQRKIVAMARRMRLLHGIKVGVEAIPFRSDHTGTPDRSLGPDWNYLTKVPGMAAWRYLYHAFIKHGYRDTLVVPAELKGKIEVHCFLTRHAAHLPTPNWPEPTTGDRDWLEAAGWVISWQNSIQDLDEGPPTE